VKKIVSVKTTLKDTISVTTWGLSVIREYEIDMTMPPARDADETVSLQLRITERLRQELAVAARANGRSLNSEIAQRLAKSLEGSSSLTEAERAACLAEYEREQAPEREKMRATIEALEIKRAELQAQRAEAERRVRTAWDAERERERAERARLVDMLERQARTEARVEALSNQVQDLEKHQENIEAIPVILSAIEDIEGYLEDVRSCFPEDDRPGRPPEVLYKWMQKKQHYAYVAYAATLPVVTADQAQTKGAPRRDRR
jgi:hypothetical protein